MKFFRPDQDQFSMFRLNKIHRCQICDAECDTSRIVARPGCCKCLVHLECFNELAAHPNSASTFRCPKCDRELSGESIRAARRQTSLTTANGNGEDDDEMMLGSTATKNITATRTTHRRQACGGKGALHHRKETSQSSSAPSDSIDSAEDASPPPEASSEEGSESSPRLRSYSQSLTFFTPYQEMERKLAAERNKANRPRDFFSWLLIMIAGGAPGQDTPQKEIQDGPTRSFCSQYMTMIHGRREEQTNRGPSQRLRKVPDGPAPSAAGKVE
jgi:hypothetical protein